MNNPKLEERENPQNKKITKRIVLSETTTDERTNKENDSAEHYNMRIEGRKAKILRIKYGRISPSQHSKASHSLFQVAMAHCVNKSPSKW
jgi:hypothetical protein